MELKTKSNASKDRMEIISLTENIEPEPEKLRAPSGKTFAESADKAKETEMSDAEKARAGISAWIIFTSFMEISGWFLLFALNLLFTWKIWSAAGTASKIFYYWNMAWLISPLAIATIAFIVACMVILVTCQDSILEMLTGWLAATAIGTFVMALTGAILFNFFIRNSLKAWGSYLMWQATIGHIFWPQIFSSPGQFFAGVGIVIASIWFFN